MGKLWDWLIAVDRTPERTLQTPKSKTQEPKTTEAATFNLKSRPLTVEALAYYNQAGPDGLSLDQFFKNLYRHRGSRGWSWNNLVFAAEDLGHQITLEEIREFFGEDTSAPATARLCCICQKPFFPRSWLLTDNNGRPGDIRLGQYTTLEVLEGTPVKGACVIHLQDLRSFGGNYRKDGQLLPRLDRKRRLNDYAGAQEQREAIVQKRQAQMASEVESDRTRIRGLLELGGASKEEAEKAADGLTADWQLGESLPAAFNQEGIAAEPESDGITVLGPTKKEKRRPKKAKGEEQTETSPKYIF